ncbi:MAG TPA: hypothetical protein VGV89_07220 [Thermoplasmata archaeon]|nr:hypothetical protein [Thermoplasmata archaeon]
MARALLTLAAAAAALGLAVFALLAWLDSNGPDLVIPAPPPDPHGGAVADFRRELHDGTR